MLLETSLVFAVSALLLIGLGQFLGNLMQLRHERHMAYYMDKLSETALAYAASSAADLASSGRLKIPVEEGGLAHGEELMVLGISDLRETGMVSQAFPTHAPYGAQAKIRVRAYNQEGLRLLQVVVLLAGGGLDGIQAGRIRNQMRSPSGHIQGGQGGVYHALLPDGQRIEAETLAALAGDDIAEWAGGFITIHEMPLRPFAPPEKSLTAILGEAVAAITQQEEAALNDRLAAFDFTQANFGRDLSLRAGRIDMDGRALAFYETNKHVCPQGFAPTIQVYPLAASDGQILAETHHYESQETRRVWLPLTGGTREQVQAKQWWGAVGIFRKMLDEAGEGNIAADRPVNFEEVIEFEHEHNGGGTLRDTALREIFNAAIGQRQRSYFSDWGDRWAFTALPALIEGGGMQLRARLPLELGWSGLEHCDSIATCKEASGQHGWLAHRLEAQGDIGTILHEEALYQAQRVNFSFVYGWPVSDNHAESCSVAALADHTGQMRWSAGGHDGEEGLVLARAPNAAMTYDSTPAPILALCHYLTAQEVRVMRKCVPETQDFYRGIDVVLTRPD